MRILFFTVKHISHISPILPIIKELDKIYTVLSFVTSENKRIFTDNNLETNEYPSSLSNCNYSSQAKREFEKFYIDLKKYKNMKKAHYHYLMQDIISTHTVDETSYFQILKKVKSFSPDIIIRDTVDVYGAHISKLLKIPTIGYITNNLYNEEYFKVHKNELDIFFATTSIKDKLGQNYYNNFFDRIRKLNFIFEKKHNVIHVDIYHNFYLNEDFNLIFSTNLLQPIESTTNLDYLIVYPDINKFNIESNIPYNLMRFIEENENIIYISTGSFLTEELQFYKDVIIFFQNTKYSLIISCGDKFNELTQFLNLNQINSKVYIAEYIQQKYVLSKSALFITSGGFNSILEAIFYEVPMLVRAITSEQRMNGLIIEKNLLGVTEFSFENRTFKQLLCLIINNPDIKRNLKIFRRDILRNTSEVQMYKIKSKINSLIKRGEF